MPATICRSADIEFFSYQICHRSLHRAGHHVLQENAYRRGRVKFTVNFDVLRNSRFNSVAFHYQRLNNVASGFLGNRHAETRDTRTGVKPKRYCSLDERTDPNPSRIGRIFRL